ncbi:hypothetical protein PL81_30640 [Streptomyces sp. RSD-27]|nr:hypothetical protein PL81_30640 [Streptomyces sp. RSD-27]
MIDDFLPEEEFLSLASSIQFLNYRPMHSKEWVKAYGMSGAPVMQSELVARGQTNSTPPGMGRVGALVERIASPGETLAAGYPQRLSAGHGTLTGRTVLSGIGAGLDWHNDAESLLGAYVFYGHPQWGSSWGGELLVLGDPVGTGRESRPPRPQHREQPSGDVGPDFGFDTTAEQLRNDIGHGLYVSARPNRLVVLTSHIHHRVTPVTPSAGDRPRTAIVGFFHPHRQPSAEVPA